MNLGATPRDFIEFRDLVKDSAYGDCILPDETRDAIKGLFYEAVSQNSEVQEELKGYAETGIPPRRLDEIVDNIRYNLEDPTYVRAKKESDRYKDAMSDMLIKGEPVPEDLAGKDPMPLIVLMTSVDYYIRHIVEDFVNTIALEQSWSM